MAQFELFDTKANHGPSSKSVFVYEMAFNNVTTKEKRLLDTVTFQEKDITDYKSLWGYTT